jgi:5-methylcytosine-specific restriction endonuclease McrA
MDTINLRTKITEAVSTSLTMAEAAKKIDMPFTTFKRWATEFGVYKPNQGGAGVKNSYPTRVYSTEDILAGKVPTFQTNPLRKRLLDEKIKEHKCENCELTNWLGNKIPLELEHVNGVKTDHRLENLKLLCPNCHALTPTYRGKNIGRIKDEILDTKR